MTSTFTCLMLALVGVKLGYQPVSNGMQYIIQIEPAAFQSLRPNDPLEIDVPREAQGRPAHFTVSLGDGPLPQTRPAMTSSPPMTAPAPAPIVRASPVMPATATVPDASPPGPSLAPPPGEAPVRVPPPSGTPAQPTTTEQVQPTAPAGGQSGEGRFGSLPPVNGSGASTMSERPWLVTCLLLLVIGLAASNGYVGWLFWDARQRYLGLLSRTFAPAK